MKVSKTKKTFSCLVSKCGSDDNVNVSEMANQCFSIMFPDVASCRECYAIQPYSWGKQNLKLGILHFHPDTSLSLFLFFFCLFLSICFLSLWSHANITKDRDTRIIGLHCSWLMFSHSCFIFSNKALASSLIDFVRYLLGSLSLLSNKYYRLPETVTVSPVICERSWM